MDYIDDGSKMIIKISKMTSWSREVIKRNEVFLYHYYYYYCF